VALRPDVVAMAVMAESLRPESVRCITAWHADFQLPPALVVSRTAVCNLAGHAYIVRIGGGDGAVSGRIAPLSEYPDVE
ncbi:MAG: hypothetical protein Q8Q62_13735, partial [Mesorhizobium sp.]|nr:hypothetical protein [Mesorhizobium sp.]